MTAYESPENNILGLIKRHLPYAWVAIMLVAVLLSALTAYRKSLNTQEYAFACDPFGYLLMAKEIRASASEHRLPDFRVESKQTRLLIEFMQSKQLAVPTWEEIVAPHAHHYFPRSGYVGVQYPPGTGLTLAAFPEGAAVYRLNQVTVVLLLLVTMLALVLAGWKKAWMSATLIALAAHMAFTVLARIDTLSFSINAIFVPLMLACLLVLGAVHMQPARPRTSWVLALVAGLLFGFCVLIRLPTFLLTPGLLILLWPAGWRIRVKDLPIIFCLGVLVAGVVPVLVNQQHVAGAWYLSTYASVDAALPNVSRVKENLPFFFGRQGPAAKDNWILFAAAIGFAGFVIANRNRTEHISGLTWKRIGLAALVAWLLSAIFFVTHWVTGPHYMIPTIFACVVLVGFGAFACEVANRTTGARLKAAPAVLWLAPLLIILPGVLLLYRAVEQRTSVPVPPGPNTHAPVQLPAELSDDQAWVWADLTTGTLWYYDHKPAFKIQFTDPQTRALLFRFVFNRGERQYLVQDSEEMQRFMKEIAQLGGTLELRGKIEYHPYFLVHWPSDGPAKITANQIAPNQ